LLLHCFQEVHRYSFLTLVDGGTQFPADGTVTHEPLEFVQRQHRVVSCLHHELVGPVTHDQEVGEIHKVQFHEVEVTVDVFRLQRGKRGGGSLQLDLVLELFFVDDTIRTGTAVGVEGAILLGHSEVGSEGETSSVEHHPGDSGQEDLSSISLVDVSGMQAD